MLVFVDTEHASGYEKPWGERLLAARTRIKYRLEDITGDEVYIARYDRLDQAQLDRLGARALFLSGSATTIEDYGAEQDGINEVIRRMDLPMFGFCGGLQMMAVALDVDVVAMPRDEDGEIMRETGYEPTPFTAPHSLLEGMSDAPVMRHAHGWELAEVPEGFSLYSSTDMCTIQMVIHDELPVIGTQFHPEYWTDEHPEGKRLIENFCRRAELIL